jgi:endoglucanase
MAIVPNKQRRGILGACVLALVVASVSAPAPTVAAQATTDLYVPPPNRGARRQIADLRAERDKEGADLIGAMIDTPQAVWFTAGTPKTVEREVRLTVTRAAAQRTIPVLVAYNIPFRDCAQFSAGGATTPAEYEAWIRGFAAGIGDRDAIVILEPDGLGIIPWYDPYGSADGTNALEWCQPAEADPATAAAERFAMLNDAVDVLAGLPGVTTFLDGTHAAWLGVGDIADRLVRAGVEDAEGFFLNVSNYQFTSNSAQYGHWISSCIAFATQVVVGAFFDCPNQYWNGGPLPAKIAELEGEWTGTALDRFGEWSDETDEPTLNTSGINLRYETLLGSVQPEARYVIDTSRNGVGPWAPPAGYPDPQDWCNPPDRALGSEPTLSTGDPLIAALLWVKIPGESDGECTRGLGPAGTTVDPEWGLVDPAAGDWFPEMALQLARNSVPPLRP